MINLLTALAILLPAQQETVVPAAEARVRTVGGKYTDGWNLWSNGSVGDWFRVGKAGKVAVTIKAAGQPAAGVWPKAAIRIGTGFYEQFDVESREFRDYRFEAEVPAGPCTVTVSFLNDYIKEGDDRNLLLREIRVSGAALAEKVPDVRELTEAGIEKHRKGRLVVQTSAGATVRVTQLRHDFGFGTALASHMFTDRVPQETRERYYAVARGNFNASVIENAIKWPNFERHRGKHTPETADAIVKFANENHIRLRGHCIFWAGEKWIPAWVKELSDDELRAIVEKRIRDICERYRGKIDEYDVNNEMLHHDYYARRLGPEIRLKMFEYAHRIDPGAPMYLNDYHILRGDYLAEYEKQIAWFLENKAPVGGIGCQGHFDGLPPYDIVMNALNRLARFGLPITVTEFDINTEDEARKARDLDAFFRMCFSHPAVDGIFMWGFWEGAHWRPNAALWKKDFTPTPAAEAYRNLLFREWWTKFEGKADAGGRCAVEVYYGKHRVEAGGETIEIDFPRKEGKEKTVRAGN